MSSPKAAAKVARRPAKILAAKPKVEATGLSADAIKLAGEIERVPKGLRGVAALHDGREIEDGVAGHCPHYGTGCHVWLGDGEVL